MLLGELGLALFERPLWLYRSMPSWLSACGTKQAGIYIVDRRAAAARLFLGHHELVAEDLEHGLELERLIKRYAPMPRVLVPRSAI